MGIEDPKPNGRRRLTERLRRRPRFMEGVMLFVTISACVCLVALAAIFGK
jgi:hypothetical protein